MKTGRRIEDLVAPGKPRRTVLRPGSLPGAVRAPTPDRIEPQLATATTEAPAGEDWLHEIKFDGYRTLARQSRGEVRLLTRGGLDWTRSYGDLAEAFAALPCRDAVIDGEIVALDAKGVSRFAALQAALSRGVAKELVFFAFDLLHLNGWDITAAPLVRRKALVTLLSGATARAAIQFSDHVAGGGPAFFERVSELGLEGVVSKRGAAPYQPGRSRTWTKTKALRVGDFVVAGYTTSEAVGGLAAWSWLRLSGSRLPLPQHEELQPRLSEPREALDAEYKGWLNLAENDHRAVLAKAAIALANHGGGYIVIGFEERGHTFLSSQRPDALREITQDDVNSAIRRYATPEFHCDTHRVAHPESGNVHPIIVVPGNLTEPVMSKRDCPGVIVQNRCYIRKPSPGARIPRPARNGGPFCNAACAPVARICWRQTARSSRAG